MIKYICDNCFRSVITSDIPSTWARMMTQFQDGELTENHFCSWECLAIYRSKEEGLKDDSRSVLSGFNR